MATLVMKGRNLGIGKNGAVYIARIGEEKVAIMSSLPFPSSSFNMLLAEELILRRLAGCPYVVSCLGSFHTIDVDGATVQNLVLEYVNGGSLADSANGRLTEHEVQRLARSFARGLAYVHSKGYVHYDVKLVNILVSLSATCDADVNFGLAKRGSVVFMSHEDVDGCCSRPWTFGFSGAWCRRC